MILSIGMIVKNEEKYLDECLTALKPILENIKSELIIVDTGSTDKTVEIAKRYTDKVYYFEWCNDFAAARNVTIDYAKGEWYMFIDADEIIENANEIIEFFKSKKYKKYMSASYYIVNYKNKERNSSSSVLIPRMRKLTKETRFIGIVHEQIPFILPVKNLTKTKFNHYGYILASEKQAKAKHKRNIDLLLKQLETMPNNPKLRKELGESYTMRDTLKNREEALKHYKIGKELAIKEGNNNMYCALSINLMATYAGLNKHWEVLNEADLYFKSKSDILASDTDVYYYMLFAFNSLNKYAECVETYIKYKEHFDKYADGKHTTREAYNRALICADNFSLYLASLNVINSYFKLERCEEAKELIKKMLAFSCEFKMSQDFLFKLYLEVMRIQNNYDDLKYLYTVELDRNEEFESNLQKSIESFINERIEEKHKIISLLSKLDIKSKSPYITYMKIRQVYEDKSNDVKAQITEFLNEIEKFDIHYFDIVYYVLKYNMPLKLFKSKLDFDCLLACFDVINRQYDDFLDTISSYTYESNNPYEAYLLKSIYEVSITLNDADDKEIIINSFKKYLKNFEIYLINTYNENILNDENIDLVPKNIQFGYYCMKANEALANNSKLNYIKLLRKALSANNSMKNLISILTESLEENEENNIPNELSEFEILAITIKNNIKELINKNNFNDAKLILAEYKTLNPNDIEIQELEKTIN